MNTDHGLCPLCGVGKLVEHHHERQSELDGHKFVISGLLHSVCDGCGERVTTPDESRHNKRVISDARVQAVAERDRLQRLTPADILRIRKKLGLTQAQAARVFGGGTNAFSKYENSEVVPSDGMERLLRLADSVPVAGKWLLQRAGLPTELAEDPAREESEAFLNAFRRHIGDALNLRQHFVQAFGAAIHGSGTSASRSLSFTYAAKDAANDPELPTRPELAKVG